MPVNWDPDFNPKTKRNQVRLFNICNELRNSDLIHGSVKETSETKVRCFIVDFQIWLRDIKNMTFPVEEEDFTDLLYEYAKSPGGEFFTVNKFMGFKGKELVSIQFEVRSKGTPFRPASEMMPYYRDWESFVDRINLESGVGINRCF